MQYTFPPTGIGHANYNKIATKAPRKPFKVLCIDGGGVRGLIPARILQALEAETGKPCHELFDMLVGTSTGGIIAIALATPKEKTQTALYSAEDIVNLYLRHAQQIFSRSLFRKLGTGWGLWGSRYTREGIDKVLGHLLGASKLADTLKPLAVVSYSLNTSQPRIWTTIDAQKSMDQNFFLQDIAGATSAAPTYFPPKIITCTNGTILHEADGGLYANNPETVALIEALKIDPTLTPNDILMVSLGTGVAKVENITNTLGDTGVIGWLLQANLLDIIFNANSAWAAKETHSLIQSTYRLQIDLPQGLGRLDNCAPSNLQGLMHLTEEYLKQNAELIQKVGEVLK